jgi:hypothetical protein
VLVARVAEVDKPLAVECAGHFLQDRDAAGVVLDEVIVVEEDRSDLLLGGKGWKWN